MTLLEPGRRVKAGVYRIAAATLDANGRPMRVGDPVRPAVGQQRGTWPVGEVVELTSPRAIRVRWQGFSLDEPCWSDPASLIVVAKPI